MSVLSHPVSAPRGATMSCSGWPQEAALRLLMNQLDSLAAWRPDGCIVYGASEPAAHRSLAVDAVITALTAAVFLTHTGAPRVRLAKPQSVLTHDPGHGSVRQGDAGYPEALAAVRPSGVNMSLGATDMNATYRAGGQAQ